MSTKIKAGTSTTGAVVDADTTGILELQSGSTPTTAVTIDTAQNVGIGTTTPANKVHIQQTSAGASLTQLVLQNADNTSGTGSAVGFANHTSSGLLTGKVESAIDGGNAYSMRFYTYQSGLNEGMRITAGGNLCVGTTTSTPGGRLTVVTGSDEAVWTKTSAGASSANMISWNSADSGNNYFHGFNVNTAGDAIGSIDYNRAAGLVRYNTTSDATLKNIIGDFDGQRSLEILNTTRIREFAWKSDTEQKTQIGVIAQELYETYKGAVSVGGENDKGVYRPWGVDKTAFTFHLISGWQAHEKLIQELKAQVDAQATVIADLTTRLETLEAK
jgi:hypothetical protein